MTDTPKLERLSPLETYINPQGQPTGRLMQFWQFFCAAIETAFSGINANITAIVAAQADADAAQASADAAQADADTLATAQYLVAALSGALTAERVLSGGSGVTVTFGAGTAVITINVATAQGFTSANKAGETFTGAVDVQAALRADSLRLDQAATASAVTTTHTTPIDINGTTYYLMLSNVP